MASPSSVATPAQILALNGMLGGTVAGLQTFLQPAPSNASTPSAPTGISAPALPAITTAPTTADNGVAEIQQKAAERQAAQQARDAATTKAQSTAQVAVKNLNAKYASSLSKLNDLVDQAKQARAASASSGGSVAGLGKAYTPNGNLSASRNKALQTAFSYVGNRYVLGGTSHAGIDCSGLVMAVYDQFGFGKYLNSHNARLQAQEIPGVRTSVQNLRPGDIVAWRGGGHIAIYAGNGKIVAAAAPGEGVKYQNVWGDVYGIALRLPGE